MSNSERSVKIGFVCDKLLVKKVAFSKGNQAVLIIGKSNTCDIILEDSTISKQHAQILHNENNELFLIDLDSSNGTFINDRKLEPGVPYPIKDTDDIQFSSIGAIKLTFDPDKYPAASKQEYQKGPQISESGNVFGTTDIIDKVRQKGSVIIGRSGECDVVLPDQNTISRRHARIERKGNDFILSDLGSLNGTYLNGRRISGSVKVQESDTIFIGRFQIQLKGRARDLSTEVSIKAASISKQFSNGKIGLHPCSFDIPSKTLTAVMGPSGCGKSTLLKALNGDAPPSSGKVSISGLDFHENFDYLKTQIGYVPQDDIVHRELTVEQSLYFAARLRLERADQEFLNNKIETVLRDLNIGHIRSNLVGEISGGQRKRVSIAVEILTDPLILFLDEPTSPLDPQTIEEFLGILKNLAKKGTTVMMVTHKPEDLHYMDSVIFMAEGGYLVYQGDSKNYLNYFQTVDTVKVYAELAKPKSQKWIDKRPIKGNTTKGQSVINPQQRKSVNFFSQFWWLTARYFTIKFNDKVNTGILIAQAPIIACLICLIFDNISQAVPFLMAISAIWFGTNNAAREIVGETAIYKRERMFNQGILPYVLSKITVLGAFATLQSLLFVLIIFVKFHGNSPSWNEPFISFLWMLLLSIAASLLGLLLSALVSSTEKVMTLVPIALIPQIMLAGIVTKINSIWVEFLSYFTLARWGTEGFSLIQKNITVPNIVIDKERSSYDESTQDVDLVLRENGTKTADAKTELVKQFHDSYPKNFGDLHATVTLDLLMIVAFCCLFFILIYITLKRKDSMKS